MQQFCAVLDVDPAKVTWDAATETVEGDVQAVIWNILRTRFGEDWDPDARPETAEARLREALDREESYLQSHFNHEVGGVMPSDIEGAFHRLRQALSPPSGGDEAKKSEGGVEGHATARPSTSSAVIWPGDDRGTAREAPMTSCRGDEAERSRKDGAGIKPGPSDPSPPADRREIVARIKAAVTKHCHVNMKWPATAQLDESHFDDFVKDISAAIAERQI
jgi:hypothetical protein